MADNDNQQSVLKSPPVIGAIITSIVTLIVTVITLSYQPSPTPEPQVITATPISQDAQATSVPATSMNTESTDNTNPTPTDEATVTALPIVPTATSAPPVITATQAITPNLTLLYDDVSFTIHNISDASLDLTNLSFSSTTRTWESTQWGASLVANFPADNCLRMRDVSAGNRQPPDVCDNLYAFVTVAESALFWLEEERFEVIYNGETIAMCDSNIATCEVAVPQ